MDMILKSIQEESLGLLLLDEQHSSGNDARVKANLGVSCKQTHFIGQLMNTKRKHVTDCYDLQFNVDLLHSKTVRML